MPNMTFAQALNDAHKVEMERDANIYVAGEDVGEIYVPSQELESFSMDNGTDLSAIGDVMPDYDILIEVPVQLENIRDNVDRLALECMLFKKNEEEGAESDYAYHILYYQTRPLVDGAFTGTIRFPLIIPPEEGTIIHGNPPELLYPMNFDAFWIRLALHDQLSDTWEYATTAEYNPAAPAWRITSTEFNKIAFWQYISW